MATPKQEHKLRMLALREKIIELIEAHGQLHSHQLASMIGGVQPISIASCCVSLEHKGWLAHGEMIRCNDGYGDILQGWIRGENRSPLPHPDDGLRRRIDKPLEEPKHSDRIRENASTTEQSVACGVTDEDLQWMAFYRKKYHQRQTGMKPVCVIHHQELTATL